MGRVDLSSVTWRGDQKRGREIELPRIEDDVLICRAFQILIRPGVQVDCFLYVGVDFSPDVLPAQGGGFEYSAIPLFPNMSKNKAW